MNKTVVRDGRKGETHTLPDNPDYSAGSECPRGIINNHRSLSETPISLKWSRPPPVVVPPQPLYLVGEAGGWDRVGPVLRWWMRSSTAHKDPREGQAG